MALLCFGGFMEVFKVLSFLPVFAVECAGFRVVPAMFSIDDFWRTLFGFVMFDVFWYFSKDFVHFFRV